MARPAFSLFVVVASFRVKERKKKGKKERERERERKNRPSPEIVCFFFFRRCSFFFPPTLGSLALQIKRIPTRISSLLPHCSLQTSQFCALLQRVRRNIGQRTQKKWNQTSRQAKQAAAPCRQGAASMSLSQRCSSPPSLFYLSLCSERAPSLAAATPRAEALRAKETMA